MPWNFWNIADIGDRVQKTTFCGRKRCNTRKKKKMMKAKCSTECWAEHVQQNQASPGKARSHWTGTYPDAPPITILQIEQHSHDVTHSFSSLGSLGSEVKRLQLVRGTSTWASLGAKLPEPVVSLTSAKTLRRWLWSYIFCAVQPLDDWGKWLQHDFLGWLNSTSIFISYLLYLFFWFH